MRIAVTHVPSVSVFTPIMAFAIRCRGSRVDAPIDADHGVMRSGLGFDLLVERQCEEDPATAHRPARVAKRSAVELIWQITRPGPPQRNVASPLAVLQDNRPPPQQTRGMRSRAIRAHCGISRGDAPNRELREVGRQTTRFGRLVSRTVPVNQVGKAAVIEADAADGVTGLLPCLNGPLRRLNGHRKSRREGADDFHPTVGYCASCPILNRANSPSLRPLAEPAFRRRLKATVPCRR
jgi:hypothetical protein